MKFSRFLAVVSTLLVTNSPAEQIVFSEIMYHPPLGGYEFVEVQNLTATPFDIADWRLSGGADYDFPTFNAGIATESFLKAFERIIICETDPATFRAAYGLPNAIRVFGPWIGQLANAGERVSLKDKNDVVRCTMRYNDRHPWPVSADGAGHSLVLADTSRAIDDYRVWRASAGANPTPGSPEPASAEESFPNPEVNLSSGIPFVQYADKWSFNDQNVDLGTTWKDNDYNFSHSGWTMANDAGNRGGLYGFETSSLPEPGLNTALLNSDDDANHLTYYFRKEFTYTGATTGATVTIDMINDDGAYFYLNGNPIGGLGATANGDWKDSATRTVSNATEELGVASNNGSALVVGTNVISAEVHQTNDSSSDCVFGARLSIAAPSVPSVVINEVLPSASGFVEFFNPTGVPIDIGGWYLSDEPGNLTKHQIPGNLMVPNSGLVSVGFTASGLSVLANTSVYLTQADGTSVSNAISAAIPLDGRSLGRKGDGSSSWFLFTEPSQDSSNSSASSEFSLKLNEVHLDSSDTIDWVELYNPGTASVSTSGLFIASLTDFSDKIPLGSAISSEGHVSWETSFIDQGGDRTLYLIDSSNNVLDAIALEQMAPRDHYAAYPDGSGEFFASISGTRNASNNPTREQDIVITELMVDPPSGHRDGEFIELYNKGASSIDLSGWSFDQGVDFVFPAGTSLGSGRYLVVAANAALTSSAHGGADVIGQYDGELSNGGELLSLRDSWGNLADEVHYHTGGTWPQLAGGLGSSMELRHPSMDNSRGTAWADSDESNKSTFASYSLTESYLQLTTRGSASDYEELHIQCVGDSHLAMKNMSLTKNGSGNMLPNAGNAVVTNGNASTGWLCQGTHYSSYYSGGEFHIISDGHGDVKANRCEIDVTQISRNDVLTFNFEARWISGKPTILVETWDRSFGGIFHLPIPNNLGTPGAANSAAISNAAPVVSGLIHSPAVPTSSDSVVVTAEVSGATTVNLRHRLDNNSGSGSWLSTPMNDAGTGGDERANDGIFSVTLTQYQSDNSIVQFYVEATSAGETTVQPAVAPGKPAMWVVDNTNHASDLRTERFVISAQDVSASGGSGDSSTFNYAFPRLSNHYFNATFIGDEREIIYNCEFRKSGSPWTRSSGADFARAKWKTPGDRRFRGYSKRAIDNDAGGSRAYHNRIIRYWLYLFGHAANENEFIRVMVNGGSSSVREDVEPNATDFMKRNWKDGQKGELYRIDDEWWFDDNWGRQNRNADWSYKGTKEPERYSSEWIKRSRESEYDYSSFTSWVEKVGGNSFNRDEIERMADIDLMAANAVVRGWCDDWDTLTRNRGKNGYFMRRATDGKWMLVQWDSDLTFGDSNAAFIGNLSGVRNFFNKPYVRQRVNYYLGKMVNEYTANSARLSAWHQCEEEASNSYGANTRTYTNWNNSRLSRANSEMGSALNTNFNVTSGNGSSATTSADTYTLGGVSSYKAFKIEALNHPEAEWSFSSQTGWSLSNIQLKQGTNSVVVQAMDEEGKVVDSETFTITKTGNAFPVVDLDGNPGSFNAPVSKPFIVDAVDSYDPEGTALSYSWSITPAVSFTQPTASSASFNFTTAGLYQITLTATDGDNQQTVETREVAVYSGAGWTSFNEPVLSGQWTLQDVELRDNSSPSASYSLDDVPNSLTLKIEEDSAKPLRMNSPNHPIIWRELPGEGDWSLHTDVRLATAQQGNFITGLIAEVRENGTSVRYVIGMEDGDFLRVKRSTGGSYTQLANINWSAGDAVIRIRRTSNQLYFEYRGEPGEWTRFYDRSIPGGSIGEMGGIFAATDTAQSLRLEFDYALLVDPEASSETLDHLRLTEIMYNPTGGGSLEYLEFLNTGSIPLLIQSVTTDDTKPFAEFTFGNVTLAAGARGVLVVDPVAFEAEYGPGITILGQWTGGALSNSGESIVLRDPLGNVIHDFAYDDLAPWPLEADGQGASLEVIDSEGNYNDPLNWRASITGGTPGTAPISDADNDGLSDSEEETYGTNPLVADTDKDGFLDGEEVAAGTNPLSALSFLKALIVSVSASGNQYALSWESVSGKVYILQTSTTMKGDWLDIETITATGPVTVTSHTSSDSEKFYRVKVE
ncbi:MAG: lamin tail domain-containing protein [Akkermansiaceae bacterium]|nr:lamin tail domain-containing protein [Akkermansiaceae bacterium]